MNTRINMNRDDFNDLDAPIPVSLSVPLHPLAWWRKVTYILTFAGVSFAGGWLSGVSSSGKLTFDCSKNEEYNRGFRFGYETGVHDTKGKIGVDKSANIE